MRGSICTMPRRFWQKSALLSLTLLSLNFGFTRFGFGKLSPLQKQVKASLVAYPESINGRDPFWVALRLEVNPGWHVYWINPGDSGAPITVDWNLPGSYSAGELHWPLPHRLPVGPLMNYGFEGTVYIVAQLRPSTPSDFEKFSANAKWLVCKETCNPESATVELSLPVRSDEVGANRSEHAEAIEKVLSVQPVPLSQTTKEGASYLVELDSIKKVVKLNFSENKKFAPLFRKATSAYFFPLTDLGWNYAGIQIKSESTLAIPLRASGGSENPPTAAEVSGWLQLKTKEKPDQWYLLESSSGPKPHSAGPEYQSSETRSKPNLGSPHQSLSYTLFALAAAFLGGLILNLMPCVFPVLGIKVLHLVRYSGASSEFPGARKEIRRSTLYYLFGCLSTFWVLAFVLISLRTGGAQLGWGFQLQSPFFVFLLILILFAMALNLLGVFEVTAAKVAESLEGITRGLPQTKKESPLSSYFSGVVTTVVATPCTAPFMGSAIAYGLTQSALHGFLIFTFLGTGMAFPFLFLARYPQFLKWLPKPGRWMDWLKKSFAVPLLLTCLWLGWVYLHLTDLNGSPNIAIRPISGALISLLLGLFAFGKLQSQSLLSVLKIRQSTTRNQLIAGLLAFAGIGFVASTVAEWKAQSSRKNIMAASHSLSAKEAPLSESSEVNPPSTVWKKFDPLEIEKLRAQGISVFVDFTADWCITCQVNKKVALDREEVLRKFQEKGVILFRADWTKSDDTITKALESFDRNGVPLYVLYTAKEIKILPQILTPTLLINTLDKIQ